MCVRLFLFLTWANIAFGFSMDLATRTMGIRMPNAKPENDETYLCHPMKLDKSNTHYIVGFKPHGISKIAHHMLVYGCKAPGRQADVFNCGSMTTKQKGLPSAQHPCGSGNAVVYAWAQDAPELKLPDGVGFRVGKDTDIEWLVLQVHYATVKHIDPEVGDTSGVDLIYTNVMQPRAAGVLFLGTNGRIPAKSVTKMEAACTINEDKVIHPFAFRVHTHRLGKVVSGWKVRNKSDWQLLGRENPQLPQMFYPVQAEAGTTITKGEVVAARCTMKNYKDHAVWVGSTREDEMCNFYMMYYVDGDQVLQQKTCNTMGPPLYSWGNWFWPFGAGLSNIPDHEASTLPEVEEEEYDEDEYNDLKK